MKKLILLATIFLVGATTAYSATIDISPVSVSVTKGEMFSVALFVNPATVKSYTVKAEVSNPAGLLEIVSFVPSAGWLALTQPGYDLIDNVNGKLIKTGGYAGGFTDTKSFGIVTYKAKASGSANLSVLGTSLVLDSKSKSSLSGVQGSSVVTISDVVVPVVVKKVVATSSAVSKKSTTVKAKVVPTATLATSSVSTATTTTSTSTDLVIATSTSVQIDSASQVAAVSEGGMSSSLIIAIVALLLVVIAGWFTFKR